MTIHPVFAGWKWHGGTGWSRTRGRGPVTQYGGLSMTGPGWRGVRLGGRIGLGERVDLSLEGERTTRSGSAEHEVALHGSVR